MKVPNGVIYSIKGKKLSNQEINFFKNTNPFGFILFSRNFENRKQIQELINNLKNVTKNKNIQISVDQEGGKVQRFDNEDFFKYSPQKEIGSIYRNDPKTAKKIAYYFSYLIGYELKNIGIDINYSPVADIFFNYADTVIGNRAFDSDPKIVFDLAKEFCNGFKDSGIVPVLKHFPGHGRSTKDTHKDLSIISSSFDDLKKSDFIPFKILKNEILVMLAHIIYEQIDSKVATYSEKIIKSLLREDFGFKGLVLSDDISMKALKGSLQNKVKKSYAGGCNVILYCKGELNEMIEIDKFVEPIKKKYFDYFFYHSYRMKEKKLDLKLIERELLRYKLIKKKNGIKS